VAHARCTFVLRDAMLARYMLWRSVLPSVRHSQAGVLSERLSVSSRKQTQHDSPGTIVFDARDLGEIAIGSPPTGAPNTSGIWKICDFRQKLPISRERCIRQTRRLYERCKSYALCRMMTTPMTLNDPMHHRKSSFWRYRSSFIFVERLKLESLHTCRLCDKIPKKWVWSWSRDSF